MSEKLHIVQVAVDKPLSRVFDYILPETIPSESIRPGMRVKIPFGQRVITGMIVNIATETQVPLDKLKSVEMILDQDSLLSPSLLSLCTKASQYYHHPLGEVFFQALPKLLRIGKKAIKQEKQIWSLTEKGNTLDPITLARAPKQRDAIAFFKKGPCSSQILGEHGISNAILQALYKKGLIQRVSCPDECRPQKNDVFKRCENNTTIKLNTAQRSAVEKILSRLDHFKCFLLDGVTGSGKTEVYLRVIEQVIQRGGQALVLVPEIGLTPQALNRFQARFVAIPIVNWHSKLTDQARLNAWLDMKEGRAKIMIGTRSALFTPCQNLGIIVVDEEHDQSFKQQEKFRYSARDLAVWRGHLERIPVILGSATPSFETIYKSNLNRYQTLSLPERAGPAIQPHYRLIDIRNQNLKQGISHALCDAMKAHLEQNNQVLLFLNRRGYAPTLMCHRCGWTATCSQCDIHMTLHKTPDYLHCHHCDHKKPMILVCPQCGYTPLQNIGLGTQRLEHALQELFPDVAIIRIDRDTMRHQHSIHRVLNDIEQGQHQILIGTQMLAKGHHFPNVTLVGIINPDQGFFNPDFHAIEHTGQLILQVAGRAGRAEKPGEVIIQTHYPDHPFWSCLLRQGYAQFASRSLKERKLCKLPPFSHFALIRAESVHADRPERFLKELKTEGLKWAASKISILGPIPAPLLKIRGRYRFHLLIQSTDRKALHQFLDQLLFKLETIPLSQKVRWSLDVDPIEMG